MQFQNNFDLEEFIAYLLPGFLFLGSIAIERATTLNGLLVALDKLSSGFVGGFVFVVMFVTLSLILGHVSSVFTRSVQRPLINAIFGDPEEAILNEGRTTALTRFFTPELSSAIRDRFEAVFGLDPLAAGIRPAVPRMIRGYVFERSENTTSIRRQIVRHRAICGNLVVPVLATTLYGSIAIGPLGYLGALAIAGALLWKQRDLDVRESKEIYLNFLVITAAPEQPA